MQASPIDGWLNIVILGVVEGLTEFLPVSSTGHLIVVADLLGEHSDAVKLFEVVIQLGAILAVCWHYRARLFGIFRPAANPAAPRLYLHLFIGFLPAAFLGLLFYDFIKAHLFSVRTVAVALIVGGVVILLVERRRIVPRLTAIDQLRPRDALVVGLAQSLALFPGVSRAGATIMGGLCWGLERRTAAEFSFLLAIPTMFAAVFYDLWRNVALLEWSLVGVLLGGMGVAFVTALLTIRLLLHYVSRHKFTVFGWYRIAFGLLILTVLAEPPAV